MWLLSFHWSLFELSNWRVWQLASAWKWDSSPKVTRGFSFSLLRNSCLRFMALSQLSHAVKYQGKTSGTSVHKTVNARENFWNVYCFATNQMRDETAKDNRQTAAGISHDLIRNNELAFFYKKSLIFPLDLSEKAILWPQTKTSHLISSIQKPNCRIDLKVSANCENLKRCRSASWVKVSQLQKKYGSKTTNHS